jgi:hypothetical protein
LILAHITSNGLPSPSFETDKERETFLAMVYLHEGFEPIAEPGNATTNATTNATVGEAALSLLELIKSDAAAPYSAYAKALGKDRTTVARSSGLVRLKPGAAV